MPANLYGTDFQADPGDRIRHLWLKWRAYWLERRVGTLHFYYERITADPQVTITEAINGEINTVTTLQSVYRDGRIELKDPITKTPYGYEARLHYSSVWQGAERKTTEVRYIVRNGHLLEFHYGYMQPLIPQAREELESAIEQIVRSFEFSGSRAGT